MRREARRALGVDWPEVEVVGDEVIPGRERLGEWMVGREVRSACKAEG